jgi:alpha/beta superfamily hydrolase
MPQPAAHSPYAMPMATPAAPSPTKARNAGKKTSSNKLVVIILSIVFGGILLAVACGGLLVVVAMRSLSRPPQTEFANLMEGRNGFSTTLSRREKAEYPAPPPPNGIFQLEKYRSPAGELDAYVSPSPGDGQKHAAMIWVFGGFDNSIGETAWESASPDNDQSASAFREAGMVMMYPSFRGGNMNPGHIEGFYGEVDDLLAAADHLANKDYVDPQRIYLGGHSTGGTMVLLAAAATDRYRAIFSFGPVDDVSGYGAEVLPFSPWNQQEVSLRNPIQWLHAMNTPVFVFEGSNGNISCLHNMRRASTNPQLHFHEARGADHFSILGPVTAVVADKIRQDTGPTCNIQFTDDEIGRGL